MYVDDIMVLTKNEKEHETHIQTTRIHSQDIAIEFIKCAKLIRKISTEIQKRIWTLGENDNYKYLVIEASKYHQ